MNTENSSPSNLPLQIENISKSLETSSGQIKCSNCETIYTPLWRRGPSGSYLCNACGLYHKLHNSNRPITKPSGEFSRRKRSVSLQAKGSGVSTKISYCQNGLFALLDASSSFTKNENLTIGRNSRPTKRNSVPSIYSQMSAANTSDPTQDAAHLFNATETMLLTPLSLKHHSLPVTPVKGLKVDYRPGDGVVVRLKGFEHIGIIRSLSSVKGEAYFNAKWLKSMPLEDMITPEESFEMHAEDYRTKSQLLDNVPLPINIINRLVRIRVPAGYPDRCEIYCDNEDSAMLDQNDLLAALTLLDVRLDLS